MNTPSLHHVAYACTDLEATRHFYEDLFGLPLVRTEVAAVAEGFMRHVFFKMDDGSCVAFFDLHNAGERPGWSSAISTGNQLPLWVNHLALRADEARQAEVRERVKADGQDLAFSLDHGWCKSDYYVDPNGILVELCRDAPGMTMEPERAHEMLSELPAAGGATPGEDRLLEVGHG